MSFTGRFLRNNNIEGPHDGRLMKSAPAPDIRWGQLGAVPAA